MSLERIQRATLLLQSGMTENALAELTAALGEDPGNAQAHALRALALADLERFPEALESAERALGEAPEWPFAHTVKARVLLRMGKPKKALEPALEAAGMAPEDEDNHALVSACYVGQSRWRDALAAAERGLALAPESTQCANLRALCLRQLGEVDEAEHALRSSLSNDPENAWTFQNLGFAALRANRPLEAIEHFRESLRLDPEDPLSREGLATALKARVPLYRPIVAWQMLCERLSSKLGAGLILGFFLLAQVVHRVVPEENPIGQVILISYVAFVWMSWAGNAAFDVMLLAKRDLRHVLRKREQLASAGVIVCLVLALVILAFRVSLGLPNQQWTAVAAAFAAIPMAGWAKLPNGKARTVGILVAAGAFVSMVGGFAFELMALSVVGWDLDAVVSGESIEAGRIWLERSTVMVGVSLLTSVGSTWLLTGLGFVPEARGGRGERRRPNR